ncbi:anthranilate phosphoribosyltransferase [Gonapodya prolifera JEL478]|uniref:Anthranilate phosphoribosyltransferase n=1 Tax=Gonapodya prolifera (strain JEL478) TaxID=1344416 RepID=A0A139AE12_GONPJ|nr:anthranilate phosphoribosyltransferase [Gonapodya prolifera JEL478]|eukprot:KXS15007.1 anthranilate phosphoribosyltransferase [Gonapodya prolifera JEL478]
MPALLKHMLASPENVTPELVDVAMRVLFAGEATPAQTAAFLVGLKAGGRDQDPAIIASAALAMRSASLPIPFDTSLDSESVSQLVDIVGTGGDGQNTFNVSTAAGFVAAGAGCFVSKHGNRAATSQSGSADTLEHLGASLTSILPTHVPHLLRSTHYCFLFAQTFHPAMRHVAATRREIGVRTVFNMLGPLTNPARPKRMVVGVHSKELGGVMIKALALSGAERAVVVCGDEGLDEISPSGPTHCWHLESPSGPITELTLTPSSFGLPSHSLSAMRGGDPSHNAGLMRSVLGCPGYDPETVEGKEQVRALRDWVLMNASAVLWVAGKVGTLEEGVKIARESLESGKAWGVVQAFVDASRSLGGKV